MIYLIFTAPSLPALNSLVCVHSTSSHGKVWRFFWNTLRPLDFSQSLFHYYCFVVGHKSLCPWNVFLTICVHWSGYLLRTTFLETSRPKRTILDNEENHLQLKKNLIWKESLCICFLKFPIGVILWELSHTHTHTVLGCPNLAWCYRSFPVIIPGATLCKDLGAQYGMWRIGNLKLVPCFHFD